MNTNIKTISNTRQHFKGDVCLSAFYLIQIRAADASHKTKLGLTNASRLARRAYACTNLLFETRLHVP